MTTVKQLKEWLATLPPEFENAQVQSLAHSFPLSLKRTVAYRSKHDPQHVGVVFNPMGTHFDTDFYEQNERISTLAP